METEKLYYADPFLTDFTATVLDCQPGDILEFVPDEK